MSYITDTTHVLHKLNSLSILSHNALLVTLDVKSLYTNTPHYEGITTCDTALTSRIVQDVPTDDLITLLSCLIIGDNQYLQIHGTAMGTRMAPSYANILIAQLEQALLARESVLVKLEQK